MRTYHGNIGLIIKDIGEITINTLKKYSDYNKLACSKESDECYFYIGSSTESEKLSGKEGNLSFRLMGNSSFQLDSLDMNVSNPTEDDEFNFAP